MLQPGALYPARLLLLVLDVPAAMHVSAVVHIVIAGVGAYAFCRTVGMQNTAAATGFIVYSALFGFRQFQTPSFLESGAWLAIVCCAVARVAQGHGWANVVALALAGALCILAGAYHIALYVGYAALVVAVALGSLTKVALVRLVIAGVLAVGLAGPQLLPTLAWTSETVRQVLPLTDAQIMPVESAARSFAETWKPPQYGGPDSRLYLSVPVMLLAVIGWCSNGPFGAVVGSAGIVAFILMLGPGTPFFGIYQLVPGLAMVRVPQRLIVLVAFFFAIGAALGVKTLIRIGSRLGILVRNAIGFALLAGLVAILVPAVSNSSQLPWTVPDAYWRRSAIVATILGNYAKRGRVSLPSDTLYPRTPRRLGMIGGLRVLQDYDPLSSRRLSAYLHAVVGEPTPTADAAHPFKGAVQGPREIVRPQLLDLLSVRVLVLPRQASPPARETPYWRLRLPGVRWQAYENPQARPRAYLVGKVRLVDDEVAALAAVSAEGFDGTREAVALRSPREARSEMPLVWTGAVRGAARIIEEHPERVVIEFETDRRSFLVLTDAFAPGWRVAVDGKRRRLWQTNHSVRGVVVEAGQGRVVFSYEPPGYIAGVVAATLACFIVGGVALMGRGRRGRAGAHHRQAEATGEGQTSAQPPTAASAGRRPTRGSDRARCDR